MRKNIFLKVFTLNFIFQPFLYASPNLKLCLSEIKPFVLTDAHEGPVYVRSQNRLYFTTTRNIIEGIQNVSVKYLNLNNNKIYTFIKNANMANGMFLSNDGNYLLIAEQGNSKTNLLGRGCSSILNPTICYFKELS